MQVSLTCTAEQVYITNTWTEMKVYITYTAVVYIINTRTAVKVCITYTCTAVQVIIMCTTMQIYTTYTAMHTRILVLTCA